MNSADVLVPLKLLKYPPHQQKYHCHHTANKAVGVNLSISVSAWPPILTEWVDS